MKSKFIIIFSVLFIDTFGMLGLDELSRPHGMIGIDNRPIRISSIFSPEPPHYFYDLSDSNSDLSCKDIDQFKKLLSQKQYRNYNQVRLSRAILCHALIYNFEEAYALILYIIANYPCVAMNTNQFNPLEDYLENLANNLEDMSISRTMILGVFKKLLQGCSNLNEGDLNFTRFYKKITSKDSVLADDMLSSYNSKLGARVSKFDKSESVLIKFRAN